MINPNQENPHQIKKKIRNLNAIITAGIVVVLFGAYIAYSNKDLDDDSDLVGSSIMLVGVFTIVAGYLVREDSKK